MTKDELRKSLDFVNEERERLQKENDELKKIKETFGNENVIFFISGLIDKRNDYKARINKAIEYLKENACYIENNIFVDDLCCDECMELLNILRGEDK